jgi:predicted metal-dependent HD superfamily phosphohydrolase
MDLHERFLALARSHGAELERAEAWWHDLEARYSDPHRHYHTLVHIGEMLALLPHADETLLAAVWFHDAVYGGEGNEERSAELAHRALTELGFPAAIIEDVQILILATRTHDPSTLPPRHHPLLDADLAILGSTPDRYREYAGQVRKEYSFVPDPLFRQGRAAVLRKFLERPSIFATEEFRARLEARARENLAREITELA